MRLGELQVQNGGIEAVKWLALVLMVVDHANAYLLGYEYPAMFAAGRLVFPLFAIVLGFNLARPGALDSGALARTSRRMALVGCAALVPVMFLHGRASGVLPLNIMFTMLLGLMPIWAGQQKHFGALVSMVILLACGGVVVEYFWFGPFLVLCSYWFWSQRTIMALVALTASTASLYFVNENFWALAALPLFALIACTQIRLPRVKWAFYAFYPAHLALVAVAQRVITG